jgi:hypothetical protein
VTICVCAIQRLTIISFRAENRDLQMRGGESS